MFSPHTYITHTEMLIREKMDMLINITVVIISHCIGISKHEVIYLKYRQFLYVSKTLIGLPW